MTVEPVEFSEPDQLGVVEAVDTGRAQIHVSSEEALKKCLVGSLVAIAGRTSLEWLVGVVDQVRRSVHYASNIDAASDELGELQEQTYDSMRLVLLGMFWTKHGERKNVFRRGIEHFPEVEKQAYSITGKNLEGLVNSLAAEVDPDKQMILGQYIGGVDAKVVANGDKFFQRHAALLGSTGSGKSWATALVLERASRLPYANLIVLDMHGEYAPLAGGEQGQEGFASGFRVAGPGDLDGKHEKNVLFLPHWCLNREELLALFLDRSDYNAPNQASRLAHHVYELRKQTVEHLGLTSVAESMTVDSPIPFKLEDLRARLKADDEQMVEGSRGEKQGPLFGKLSRLITRFDAKVMDRRYGFTFQAPDETSTYDWLVELAGKMLRSGGEHPGIKIVDFSEVPADVLPVIVGVLARILYNIQFWMEAAKRTPFAFVCDEAHLYLPTREETDSVLGRSVEVFERIAKEGRKYGVALLVVSQRPSDVSRTILSQCNNFLALRLTNDTDQGVVKRLMPDSMAGLIDALPLLDTGEGLLLGDAVTLPARVRLDRPSITPASATKAFWTEWGAKMPDANAIGTAVESMRTQSRKRLADREEDVTEAASVAESPKGKKKSSKSNLARSAAAKAPKSSNTRKKN
ncbi:MAG: ATP-binding protein [Planctomycetota bacterium]